jgi:hypothetical protein
VAVTSMAFAPTIPLPKLPPPPVGVQDPSTFFQKAMLQPYLDPTAASFYGNAYTPQYTAAQARAQAGLAGLGGFTWGVDDPNTPQNEALNLTYNDQAPLGQRQIDAVQAEQGNANARGILYSSFANRNIGAALGRLTEQGRAVVNQYASDIANIGTAESTQGFNLYTQLAGLYGQDALYAAQNPPAPPLPTGPPAVVGGPTSAAPTLLPFNPNDALGNASAFKNIDQTIPLGYNPAMPALPIGGRMKVL